MPSPGIFLLSGCTIFRHSVMLPRNIPRKFPLEKRQQPYQLFDYRRRFHISMHGVILNLHMLPVSSQRTPPR